MRLIRDLSVKVADPGSESARSAAEPAEGGDRQSLMPGPGSADRRAEPRHRRRREGGRFRTMRRLAADGLGILFATSDLKEAMALSDRIAGHEQGRLIADFRPRGGDRSRWSSRPVRGPRPGRHRTRFTIGAPRMTTAERTARGAIAPAIAALQPPQAHGPSSRSSRC